MKRILYFNFGYSHYSNKIEAQLKAFYELGMDAYLVSVISKQDKDCVIFLRYDASGLNRVKQIELEKSTLLQSRRYYHEIVDTILNFIKNYPIDYFYVRRLSVHSIFTTKLFRVIAKDAQIIYEWPTVPLDTYDSAYKNVMQNFEVLFYRVLIKRYISKEVKILQNDIKPSKLNYEISNGVDIDKFTPTMGYKSFDGVYHFIGVAHLLHWHGYDRFVKAMAAYTGTKRVHFTLISKKTKEVESLLQLVNSLHQEKNFSFVGEKDFNQLQQEMHVSQIALGSLGYHRRGAKYDTSIKNKEYCAFGIPFVCSSEDRSFPKDFPFLFKVKDDESLINIDSIIDWYNDINIEKAHEEMYNYAKENLSFKDYYKNLFKQEEG